MARQEKKRGGNGSSGSAASPYGFDPTHGYDLQQLLQVTAPQGPEDFQAFWQKKYAAALKVQTVPVLKDTGGNFKGWRVFDLAYTSTDVFPIGGWLLLPEGGEPRRGFIITHGYGNREQPDYHLQFQDAAILFPCLRGLGRSQRQPISNEVKWHVLHDIDKPEQYILRGCVEDVWTGVSALLRLFPYLSGHVGYLGQSFGGGIGALALAWEKRIARAHLSVPTFGNHPLRLTLPNIGSGASLQDYYQEQGKSIFTTLQYYDAATAARFIHIPVHCALALYDPFVPPPGQFALFNALRGPKERFILTAGHHSYPEQENEELKLQTEVERFFRNL
ncbi:acetylxylan esterase [Desulfobulbus rhabdoformis]|uniref:acetylxylan esterase n=1 Tax=Desulfobulbus rhabdoformis TaxID=34032 RepID=UPI001964D84E|nr:acetylxylan esterase [Desulfobulbus rhabdoformis]